MKEFPICFLAPTDRFFYPNHRSMRINSLDILQPLLDIYDVLYHSTGNVGYFVLGYNLKKCPEQIKSIP